MRCFFLTILIGLIGCTSNEVSLRRFEIQQPQMGVPFRMVFYAADEAIANEASEAAFDRIAELNAIMSDYDYDSELSRLSRTSGSGQKVKVSDDLWRVLEMSAEFSSRSEGAFDVTVGPAVSLWRKARREKKFPEEERLAKARAAVGHEHMRMDPQQRTVELLMPGMRLDLGAIAKGYAVDEAMKVLRKHGIMRALVSGGGDILVSDPPPGKASWQIEVPSLDENGPSEFLYLKNRAMATSGDLFQFVELDGKRYSHIVDPRTGIGLTDHSRVLVVANRCAVADALSTSVSVLGSGRGLKFAEQFRSTAVRVSYQEGSSMKTLETPGFRKFLQTPTH